MRALIREKEQQKHRGKPDDKEGSQPSGGQISFLEPRDLLALPHPVGLGLILSVYILIAVPALGDLCSEKQVKALGCQSWDHVTPFSPMVSFMDSNTHYNQPHKMLLSHCVYVCFLCLCSALLTLTFRFEAGLLCLCKDHSAHRTSHNAPPPVLACHRSTEGMWGVRGGRKGSISYQPRVSTVGCLFILCNLALIGAKMQTQWQIRCLIPYSKPSLGDA